MNDYTTFSYGKITEKVYLTDGFLMLFEFYSQDFVVCTPAVTVWISFYLAKVASPSERRSTATLFWDIFTEAFHKSEIWAFHDNLSKLLGLSALWTCLPLAHKI